MARAANASDFTVDVDGIGRFKFARRMQKDKYLIRSQYSQLTSDHWREDGSVGDMEAWMHATIVVLLVEEPDKFLENLDPLMDDDTGAPIQKVFLALREKELSFRPKTEKGKPTEGAGPPP
jgi:hypothetical protein